MKETNEIEEGIQNASLADSEQADAEQGVAQQLEWLVRQDRATLQRGLVWTLHQHGEIVPSGTNSVLSASAAVSDINLAIITHSKQAFFDSLKVRPFKAPALSVLFGIPL